VAEITQSELQEISQRQAAGDLQRIVAALQGDGELKVVDDPKPEVEKDEEGNELPPQPQPLTRSADIKIEAEEKAAKEAEKEAKAEEKEAAKKEKAAA
jgi:hypothetical protein